MKNFFDDGDDTHAMLIAIPKTPEEFVRYAALIVEQLDRIAKLSVLTLMKDVPVMMKGPVGLSLIAIGSSMDVLAKAAQEVMTAHGIEPLDKKEIMKRAARDVLSENDPEMPSEVRDALLNILGDRSDDWPDIVLPGSGEVH